MAKINCVHVPCKHSMFVPSLERAHVLMLMFWRRIGSRDVNTLTAEDVKRLPWFFALEISPMALGDTPYGMPYSGGKVTAADKKLLLARVPRNIQPPFEGNHSVTGTQRGSVR